MPVSTRRRRGNIIERVRERLGSVDNVTLLLVLLICITGLIALYTASYIPADSKTGDPMYFISRQVGFALAGLVAMYFVSLFPYQMYFEFPTKLGKNVRIHTWLFVFCIVTLIMVPIFGEEAFNATRWINLPLLGQFQPSELMKVSVVLSFSWYASRPTSKLNRIWPGVFPYIATLLPIAFLLALEPHFSAILIIFAIAMCVLFVGGMRLIYIPVVLAMAVPAGWIYVTTQDEYLMQRIKYWIDPFLDLHNNGWQAANSHISIGSGGIWGLGLGAGRQKHFLPETQNDFVFGVWCEEMGLIGAVLVIILFAMLIYRGFYIARKAPDRLSCLIATGITAKYAIQVMVNLFVVTGLFPVTGASLPFFSSGGTALLIQFGEMGILLQISRHMRQS